MGDAYENVVGGKLKLKGKALDMKATSGGISKKKKNNNKEQDHSYSSDHQNKDDLSAATGGSKELGLYDPIEEDEEVGDGDGDGGDGDGKTSADNNGGGGSRWDDHLTPAERRYVEQREKIDMRRLSKTANKSHRDRIEDFNQYLANMSEHYDIPKVGPG